MLVSMVMKQQNVPLPEELLARIDEWRREQPEIPGRNEAIRQLLDAILSRYESGQRKRLTSTRRLPRGH